MSQYAPRLPIRNDRLKDFIKAFRQQLITAYTDTSPTITPDEALKITADALYFAAAEVGIKC